MEDDEWGSSYAKYLEQSKRKAPDPSGAIPKPSKPPFKGGTK